MYKENKNIVISISNNYSGNINIDKIIKKGYTTKGKGRGYGLTLVKEIIDKNRMLEENKEIVNNYYIQNLIVKI